MHSFSVALYFVFVPLVFGEVIVDKPCDQYNTSTPTELNKLGEGQWYEIAKYGAQENCTKDLITVTGSDYNVTHSNGTHGNNTSSYILKGENGNSTVEFQNYTLPLKVFNVNNTFVMWSCWNSTEKSHQKLVILSQNKPNNTADRERVNDILRLINVYDDQIQVSLINHSETICSDNSTNNNDTNNNSTNNNGTNINSSSSRSKNTDLIYIFLFPFILFKLLTVDM